MSALLRGIANLRTATVLRGSSITQRANLSSKPAKDVIGPGQTVLGLAVFTLTILGPAGYILSNLDNYRAPAE